MPRAFDMARTWCVAREGCGLQRASCLSKSQMQPSNNNSNKNNDTNNNNKCSVLLRLSGLCGKLSSVADSSKFLSRLSKTVLESHGCKVLLSFIPLYGI